MQKNSYSAQNIQIQEGLEAVRKRPGMYIGSVDVDGLHHLIYEIVDNSIDEALAGYCNTINIVLHKDHSVTISDNGRGIPVDIHSENTSALEVVMTKLHAGGKFDKGVYQISGGLHGVGCAVVNALSDYCVATIYRDNKIYEQRYEKGITINNIQILGETKNRGTTIHFLPDITIFKETQEFDFDRLAHRFRELAFLVKNITISITNERRATPKTQTFLSENGLTDFINILTKEKHPILKHPVFFQEKREEASAEIAFKYTQGQDTMILAFVNSINTKEGGTHVEGFKSAFTRTLNKYLKQNERLSKQLKGTLQGADTLAGLTVIISLKVSDPTFSGQTKTKLSNSEIRGAIDSITSDGLTQYFDHNPAEIQQVLEKCIQSALARIESQKTYETTLRKNPLGASSLPGKLVDCSEKDPTKSELFLVEGDSAGGTAKLGRDSRTQAILPLFGKPTNIEKMQESLTKIQTNMKLQPIIATLGTNIAHLFDVKKLRYHKVIIMADADVDGSHIRTLLLTFFFRYMRPLIEEGHMYIAMAPLYLVGTGKKGKYAYTEKERIKYIEEMEQAGIAREKIAIRRYKGLGEMNDEELWSTTMDPKSRKLTKVNIEDTVAADETFTLLLGEEVKPRREFIEENALKVVNLDI